jgi:UTP--glucose-1-phosphate uridylyltransferase
LKDRVRKAVFPAAGLGTRFLPASKAIPKEMITIVDKPSIQYMVEEAVASGVEQIIMVSARGKAAIEDHFDKIWELEHLLKERKKDKLFEECEKLWKMVEVISVRQHEPLGLGHAFHCAKNTVGDEPFLGMLPDDIVYCPEYPCAKQLIDVYNKHKCSVIALMKVPKEVIDKYGMVVFKNVEGNVVQILDCVEKPKPEKAPSDLAIVARYLFTPDIFKTLEQTKPGVGGEIQITDAIASLARQGKVYGCVFKGQRFDAGDKFGYLEATVHFALNHPELGGRFRSWLKDYVKKL